MKSQYSLGNL